MSTTPPAGTGERATPERRGPQVGFGPRGMTGGGATERSLDFRRSATSPSPRAGARSRPRRCDPRARRQQRRTLGARAAACSATRRT